MRLLVVLPYGPSATRIRARMLLGELAIGHDLTLLALAWDEADRAALAAWRTRGLTVHTVPHTTATRARSLLGDPRRPLQQMAATSEHLARLARAVIAVAAREGRPFDALHVEHLRGAAALRLADGLGVHTVFDAVDCIAELARLTRQWNPNRVVRLLAAYEEARTRRLEATLVARADAVAVAAERDRSALVAGGAPDRIAVIPNGVAALARLKAPTREPVAIFTGKLSYHANQAAVRLLLAEIWPRVRARAPSARLIVTGADPPGWLAKRAGSDGVQVIANPPAIEPLLARARVAVAPTVYSVGVQNKVLEAMGAGIPVVATPPAVEGLGTAAGSRLLLGEDPASFAEQVVRLLDDTTLAAGLGAAGHDYVRQHHSWPAAAARFEALYAAREGASARASSKAT